MTHPAVDTDDVPTLARELASAVLTAYHAADPPDRHKAVTAVLEPTLAGAFDQVEVSEKRRIQAEQALSAVLLATCEAAGLTGERITGEQMVARVAELRDRERKLIDTCHAVDQKLHSCEETLAEVRLWSYPMKDPS